MPKSTFVNLSEEKKNKIFHAALREFSTRGFSQASINQIVRAAAISKGSFYQYFSGKEDIFLYMLEGISREKAALYDRTDRLAAGLDVFETILTITREYFALNSIKPEYVQVAMLMEADQSDFIRGLRRQSAEKYIALVRRDQRRGIIRPAADAEVVVSLLAAFGLNEYCRCGLDAEKYQERLAEALQMIKTGIAQ